MEKNIQIPEDQKHFLNHQDLVLDDQDSIVGDDYYLAGIGKRIFNRLIDHIFIGLLANIIWFQPDWVLVDDDPGIEKVLFTYLIFLVYYISFEYLTGKTPGKFFTGTTVYTRDLSRPTLTDITKRSLLRLVPLEAFTFLGKKGVGLHDRSSNTIVVDDSLFQNS